ncbi:TIGR03089 family protein [Actinokineospora globicatena]|uniref:TIGR03089 family protein n=1 Tax=Actinokineospora globicatena TaxID=103729 RepID=A0A9W6QV08_9PSEU|nr:TIGR03089 family protein [Actinokineospora globicatena]MCP2302088.1 TIGR03089 family protein [Actinokineospora globicatena]GLW76250.1 TIGR03089 family protein [Actinokineospora globicatena]GLW83086.1 TIGR03089 family protein [Actinokineospora globicatena]GLW95365.1 TIGR03089 family protein [Actinokineospora globicatena]
MSLTETLLRPLRASSAKPLVTHYDDAAGTRVELSVATTANWAAKTANWLVEEHDVEPGTPVAVRLPAHWQTAGVLLGAWWAGAHVVADGPAAVTFVAPGESASGLTAAVSLDPMGRDLGGSSGGVIDFVGEARLFGDDYFGAPVPGSTPALAGLTVDEVLARAAGLAPGSRVLSTREWTVPDGVLAALVAPLLAGGSVVQVSNPARLDAHRGAERTTVDLV